MRKIEENKIDYTVIDKIKETPDVASLLLSKDNGVPPYTPGQFITVYFKDTGTPEGKSYSISSSPDEKTMNITVKAIGEFSHRLSKMNKGDKVTASLPYGFFYSESKDKEMIIIAGGIGIAPFRGMIRKVLAENPKAKINLHYSNRTEKDIVFRKELDKLAKENKNFKVNYYLTRENKMPKGMIKGRMNIEKIAKTGNLLNSEFFVCGGISLVRDIWKQLKENGVKEDSVYTEAFFSH